MQFENWERWETRKLTMIIQQNIIILHNQSNTSKKIPNTQPTNTRPTTQPTITRPTTQHTSTSQSIKISSKRSDSLKFQKQVPSQQSVISRQQSRYRPFHGQNISRFDWLSLRHVPTLYPLPPQVRARPGTHPGSQVNPPSLVLQPLVLVEWPMR